MCACELKITNKRNSATAVSAETLKLEFCGGGRRGMFFVFVCQLSYLYRLQKARRMGTVVGAIVACCSCGCIRQKNQLLRQIVRMDLHHRNGESNLKSP